MTASSPTQAPIDPARNPGDATPMAPDLAITTVAPTDPTQIPTAVIPPVNAPRHGSTTGSNDGNEGTLDAALDVVGDMIDTTIGLGQTAAGAALETSMLDSVGNVLGGVGDALGAVGDLLGSLFEEV